MAAACALERWLLHCACTRKGVNTRVRPHMASVLSPHVRAYISCRGRGVFEAAMCGRTYPLRPRSASALVSHARVTGGGCAMQEALECVRAAAAVRGCRSGILIVGGPGSGKSTLLRRARQYGPCPDAALSAFPAVHTPCTPEDVSVCDAWCLAGSMLVRGVDVTAAAPQAATRAVAGLWDAARAAQARAGGAQRYLLALDDAELLFPARQQAFHGGSNAAWADDEDAARQWTAQLTCGRTWPAARAQPRGGAGVDTDPAACDILCVATCTDVDALHPVVRDSFATVLHLGLPSSHDLVASMGRLFALPPPSAPATPATHELQRAIADTCYQTMFPELMAAASQVVAAAAVLDALSPAFAPGVTDVGEALRGCNARAAQDAAPVLGDVCSGGAPLPLDNDQTLRLLQATIAGAPSFTQAVFPFLSKPSAKEDSLRTRVLSTLPGVLEAYTDSPWCNHSSSAFAAMPPGVLARGAPGHAPGARDADERADGRLSTAATAAGRPGAYAVRTPSSAATGVLGDNALMVRMLRHQLRHKRATGVLLYGPPGTGKTLAARALGAMFGQRRWIDVELASIVKGTIGGTEAQIAAIFQYAKACAPCGVFIDEIQALFVSRDGSGGEEAQFLKNITSQLLLCLDSLHDDEQLAAHVQPAQATLTTGQAPRRGRQTAAPSVFVVAATNVPECLDPALLRPGRLDTCIHVGLPTPDERRHIFERIMEAQARAGRLVNDAAAGASGSGAVEVAGCPSPARIAALECMVHDSDGFSPADCVAAMRAAVDSLLPPEAFLDVAAAAATAGIRVPLSACVAAVRAATPSVSRARAQQLAAWSSTAVHAH
ncbi:AAA family ATPase [archaeon]|nr:MAG: AAA family ATPase [archaeon]